MLATSQPRSLFVEEESAKVIGNEENIRNFSILNGTPLLKEIGRGGTRIRGARIKIMRISRADIPVNFFNLKFRAAVLQVLPLERGERDKWSLLFFFFFFEIKLYAALRPTSSRMREIFNYVYFRQ